MNAYELLLEIADENVLSRLENGFAGMVEFSKEIEVIDWEPEFAIKDKNPEVKLGKIVNFNLPPVLTCPGTTDLRFCGMSQKCSFTTKCFLHDRSR